MADAVSWRAKYGTRFIANAALLAIVWALAWVWFTAHVKPHISTLIFGSVSASTFLGVAWLMFGSFVKKEDANAEIAGLLHGKRLTVVLLSFLPLIVFAYLTTFTLYLAAADGVAVVRLKVTSGVSSTPIALTQAEKLRAVSYFLAFRPVTAHVETLAPNGYYAGDVPLERGLPTQVTVPNAEWQKQFYVVRLMPLYNLFQLRGRQEPDMHYVVRVFVPGRPAPIEHRGLSFSAIYLGAALADLKTQSKTVRPMVTDLRNTLTAIDADMKPTDIEAIVADWLDAPEFIDTPELKPGDKVRVELESPAGKSEVMVNIAGQVNTGFLKGSRE